MGNVILVTLCIVIQVKYNIFLFHFYRGERVLNVRMLILFCCIIMNGTDILSVVTIDGPAMNSNDLSINCLHPTLRV